MKKILLVDDKASIGKVLSVYLGGENELICCADAVEAMEWLNGNNVPSLIITDIHMPHISGNEFLAYLKSNELWKDIPVVVLSAEDSSAERIRLFEAGAADYILKPFNPMELKLRVKRLM